MNKVKILTLCLALALTAFSCLSNENIQDKSSKINEESVVTSTKPIEKKDNKDGLKKDNKNLSEKDNDKSDSEVEKKEVNNPTENNSSSPEKKSETSINKIDTNLDNTKISWWYKPNKTHTTPEVNKDIKFDLSKYDALYVGNTDEKVIYLTFDEGYENGYTSKILDTLKANDVKAIFFVTSPYVKGNPELIKRMVDEGHIVGNHSNTHPSMPTVTGDETKFNNEFKDVEDKFKDITGQDIPKFFRPPMGEYSEKSLAMTKNLGYKTIFWSFAYHDWDVNKQPDPSNAKQTMLNSVHNGCVMLVHAVSKTNTEILDEVIKEIKAQGYEFKLLP